MNVNGQELVWHPDGHGNGWLLRSTAEDAWNSVLHICAGSKKDRFAHWPAEIYRVFVWCNYDKCAGELPLDMPEEELKAMAITL